MALECSVGSLSDSTNTQGKHTHDTVVQTLFVNLVWRGSCVKGKATRYQNINSIWQSACVCSWFVCSWFEKSVSDEDCWRPWNQSHLWHSLKLSAALSLRRSDRGGFWRGQGVSVQVNTKKCARLSSLGILDRVTGMHLFVCVCAGHKLWYLWKLKWSWPPKSLIPTTDSVTCLRWISWLPGNYSLSDS